LGLRVDADHPTDIMKELLFSSPRDDGWIGARKQDQKVEHTLLLERYQQIVRLFLDAVFIARRRTNIVAHRAVSTAEAFLITNPFVNVLD
jgi:hypothetical protein